MNILVGREEVYFLEKIEFAKKKTNEPSKV